MLPTVTQAYCYRMPYGVYRGRNLWTVAKTEQGKQYLIDIFFGPFIDSCSPGDEWALRQHLRVFLWYHRFQASIA